MTKKGKSKITVARLLFLWVFIYCASGNQKMVAIVLVFKYFERLICCFVFSIDLAVCFRMLLVSFEKQNVVAVAVGTMSRSFGNLVLS